MRQTDIIEVQEQAASAATVAERLVKKHGGDISAIKKTLKRDRFGKEVLWAAKWLIALCDRVDSPKNS